MLDEWDYELNFPITPKMVFAHSESPEYYWKCSSGLHSYPAQVAFRTKNKPCGCCFCSKQCILKGFNDFETWAKANHKDYLLPEWDYDKNDRLPSETFPTSNKKVYWLCSKCHKSFSSRLSDRTAKGTGCKYCNGSREVNEFNNFQTWCIDNHEEKLLKEYLPELNDGILPSQFRYASGKSVLWKCSFCGNIYQCKIQRRTLRHFGCKKCKVSGTSFPEKYIYFFLKELIDDTVTNRDKRFGYEIDIFVPTLSLAIEYNGSYYHQSSAQIKKDNEKIKKCTENNLNLLAIVNTDTDIYTNKIVWSYSRNKEALTSLQNLILNWIDSKFKTSYSNANLDNDKIFELAVRYTYGIDKDRSLGAHYPDIAEEWDYETNGDITPFMVMPGTHDVYGWKCKICGYKWTTPVQSRTQGHGCPKCSTKLVSQKWSALHVAHCSFYDWCILNDKQDLLENWDYSSNKGTPRDYSYGNSDDIISWIHKETKHQWYATICNQRKRGSNCGCKECTNARRKLKLRQSSNKGKENLEEWCIANNRQDILLEWSEDNPFKPTDYLPGSHMSVVWKCAKCGKKYKRDIRGRIMTPKDEHICHHKNTLES